MSADRDDVEADGGDEEVETMGRAEVLSLLEAGLREAHRKVESGRVRDAENEKVRQGWIKALGYIAGQYRQVEKDRELEELAAEVERLQGLEDRLDELAEARRSGGASPAVGEGRV